MFYSSVFACLILEFCLSSGGKITAIYCDNNKNEFYLPQGDLCKKCDRCAPGFGLEPIEDREVEIHPVHGAMDCRRCVVCPKGFFSKSRSFKECKICRNCAFEGKVELRKCSRTSNAKCGGSLPSRHQQQLSYDIKSDVKSNKKTIDDTESNEMVYILTAVGLLTLMSLALIGMLYYLRKSPKGTTCVNSKTDSLYGSHSTEVDSMLNTTNINMGCDLEIDSEPTPHSPFSSWKSKYGSDAVLTDADMSYLSKPIATDNTFHSLGIKLGIPENDISIIKADCYNNIVEQAYRTLDKWRQLESESPFTLEVLNNLVELKRQDIVEQFCKQYTSD